MFGSKHNTAKSIINQRPKFISEDPKARYQRKDFQREGESSIHFRHERGGWVEAIKCYPQVESESRGLGEGNVLKHSVLDVANFAQKTISLDFWERLRSQ